MNKTNKIYRRIKTLVDMESVEAESLGSDLNIAVLTSGGDAQGMNAAIRAIVRTGISLGSKVYGIRWGYQGLIDGGDNIFEFEWDDVASITGQGGTIIGSARCSEFRTKEGRLKAAINLVNKNINGLVVIGGDGSLSGADMFRKEWPELIEEMAKTKNIIASDAMKSLKIVGIVGSIDNDFCGTDMTIGTDSALHRIIECVQSITTTAKSHQRAFVLEVMGRNSGYLGLISGIAIGADYVFIPEWSPTTDWPIHLSERLNRSKSMGKKYAIVIVSEGATDNTGKSITSEEVKDVICKNVGYDTRVTVLGHVQRGGKASFFDRFTATRFGIEAVIALTQAKEDTPSYVVCIQRFKVVLKPLLECVAKLQGIKKAYSELRFNDVIEMRGSSFQRNMHMFKLLRKTVPNSSSIRICPKNIAVVHVGAPSSGSNSAIRSFTRYAISRGHCVLGFKNGFNGFFENKFINLDWTSVEEYHRNPGSMLGTSRVLPSENVKALLSAIIKNNICAIFIIGGFEATLSVEFFYKNLSQFPQLDMPIIQLPATMSNNVPGTLFSIGADTTLNVIASACDNLIESAKNYNGRAYVVETMGNKCGYLAVMSAIASAAKDVFIFEDKYDIYRLTKNCEQIKDSMINNRNKDFLYIASDQCSDSYNSKFISTLFNEECKDYLSSFNIVLGHIQQGNSPSPFDNFTAAKCGFKIAEQIINILESDVKVENKLTVFCFTKFGHLFKSIESIMEDAHVKWRIPKTSAWIEYRQIVNLLAGNAYEYESEAYPGLVIKSQIDYNHHA